MNAMPLRSLLALAAVSVLVVASAVVFKREPTTTIGSLLQLLGSGCLGIVVLTHIFESVDLFPWLRWGHPDSVGHYVDVGSAIVGLTLLPLGYTLRRFEGRRRSAGWKGGGTC